MPTSDCGADFVRFGSPGEGLRIVVGLPQNAVDGALKIDDRPEHAACEAELAEFCKKKPSTALSHEHEVGV